MFHALQKESHFPVQQIDTFGAAHRAQRIERKHVRRTFPDRQHVRITQQLREPRVFDISSATECLYDFGQHGHRLSCREELGDRRQYSQKILLLRACLASFAATEELDYEKSQLETRFVLRL